MGMRSNGLTIPNFQGLGQSLKMLLGVSDICGHYFPDNVFITQSLDKPFPVDDCAGAISIIRFARYAPYSR
jgi:hypothetical protein